MLQDCFDPCFPLHLLSLLSLLPCIRRPSIFSLKILDKGIVLYTEKYGMSHEVQDITGGSLPKGPFEALPMCCQALCSGVSQALLRTTVATPLSSIIGPSFLLTLLERLRALPHKNALREAFLEC